MRKRLKKKMGYCEFVDTDGTKHMYRAKRAPVLVKADDWHGFIYPFPPIYITTICGASHGPAPTFYVERTREHHE